MHEADIKFEVGIKQKILVDLEDWKSTSEPLYYKKFFETFFRGYCEHNNYDKNLVFRYIDSDRKSIGATTFHSSSLNAEFILFNFNTIPLLKSYYCTLMKFYLLGDIKTVWSTIDHINVAVSKTEYTIDFENKSVNYADVWNHDFYTSLANFMSFVSAQFLFNHEVAHCLNGHTKFISGSKFSNYLSENNVSKSKVLKTLEMDADAYAAGSLANYMNNFNHDDLCSIYPCLKSMEKEYISTLCVFSILSTYMTSSEYVGNSDNYLSPLMRAVLSIDVILDEFNLLKSKSINKEKYYTLVLIAYDKYAKIFDRKIIDVTTIDKLFEENKEYENELRSLWKTSLRNALGEYSADRLAE